MGSNFYGLPFCDGLFAGAPMQLEAAQMPGLAGYARYPAVDAQQRSDFAAGCPASANLSAHHLAANPGTACWVNGTLQAGALWGSRRRAVGRCQAALVACQCGCSGAVGYRRRCSSSCIWWLVLMHPAAASAPSSVFMLKPEIGGHAVQDVAAACNAVPECDFLVYYPLGRAPGADPTDRPSGVLKTARARADASRLQPGVGELLQPRDYDARYALNPLAVSYFKCALPVTLRPPVSRVYTCSHMFSSMAIDRRTT